MAWTPRRFWWWWNGFAGRIQPTTVNSRRSRTPALDAGRELAKALGLDP
ncbi:hypothetical protein GR254_24910, partial [Mycobacterium tuberculosis]|nr:hypothetical protein [Mycobacterium tuberculosis]